MYQNTLNICFSVIEVYSCVKPFLLNVDNIEELSSEVLILDLRKEDLLAMNIQLDLPTILSILSDSIVLRTSGTLLIILFLLPTYNYHLVRMDVLLVQKVHQGGSFILVVRVEILLYNWFQLLVRFCGSESLGNGLNVVDIIF